MASPPADVETGGKVITIERYKDLKTKRVDRQRYRKEAPYREQGQVEPVEQQIRGLGGSLEPPGPLPMHLHTVYMEYSECLPTLLNPLAERSCFSQVEPPVAVISVSVRRKLTAYDMRASSGGRPGQVHPEYALTLFAPYSLVIWRVV